MYRDYKEEKNTMKSRMIKIGIIAALGIAGVVTTGQLMAGTPQVVATIQTGPEWEPFQGLSH